MKQKFVKLLTIAACLFGINFSVARSADWVSVSGEVTNNDGIPLCTMVLANGQYMFSCDPAGKYNLYVPLDDSNQITLFAFCDGLMPFKTVLNRWQTDFDIKMSPCASGGCNQHQYFYNITEVGLDGVTFESDKDSLTLFNVRVESDETTMEDLIKMTLKFDTTNQLFLIDSLDKFDNVGVFNEPHFAKDVKSEIYMYRGSQRFNMDQTYTITSSGEEYYSDLEVGQVLSFFTDEPDNDFVLKVRDPDNKEVYNYIGSSYQGVISDSISIFKTGKYIVQFVPLSSEDVNLKIRFLNANRTALKEIYDDSYISASFKENIRDYAKYKIFLNKGELLSLEEPDSDDIAIKIVNSENKEVESAVGLPVKYIAEADDYCYIFIYNRKGWGESYSGTVSVKSAGKMALQNIDYKSSNCKATRARR